MQSSKSHDNTAVPRYIMYNADEGNKKFAMENRFIVNIDVLNWKNIPPLAFSQQNLSKDILT